MSSPGSDPRHERLPDGEAAAYVLAVCTILLPAIVYWQYGDALFGERPLLKLLLIAGVGGALSFACYGGRRWWRLGLAPGMVAGLGAAGLHTLYTTLLEKEVMSKSEVSLVIVVGAAPGMAWMGWWMRRVRRREAMETAVAAAAEESLDEARPGP